MGSDQKTCVGKRLHKPIEKRVYNFCVIPEPQEYLLYADGNTIKSANIVPDLTQTPPLQKEYPVLSGLKIFEVDLIYKRVYAYLGKNL